ncbi:MAG: flavodoxin family protein [Eubacteriaceae bacterium]|nr:flavodoxin family protein [Eubacteriaceae bacterium]
MTKKIVAVNAGPRKGWNTDTLIDEAIRGAESSGAVVEKYHLFRLEKYTGCISCFGCKKEKNKGHCMCNDGLTPVLEAIRRSDGLIIGSPNYLGNLTASFRALYERLVFQYLTYSNEAPCCNERPIPILLIMTSNAGEGNYSELLKNYQQMMTRFVGPTETFVSGDTQQIADYSKTDWPWFFNAEAKYERRKTVFPVHCRKVFEMGAAMGKND